MDERFTPQEIAKSLRVCIEVGGGSASKCHLCALHGRFFECDCFDELNEQAADMIEELAAEVEKLQGELIQRNDELLKLQEENRWIPVGERLPENGQQVIRYHGLAWNPKKTAAFYYEGDEKLYDWSDVTHWKPMPKGPEVGHD